jgi:hypothetical protein
MRSSKISMVRNSLIVLLILMLAVPAAVGAQEKKKKDNTGTNPLNFTYDYRLYSEMAALNDPSGSLVTSTVEFRFPFGRDIAVLKGMEPGHWMSEMGKTFAGRVKMRYKSLSLDNSQSDPFGTSELSGVGDIDVRFLWIPYMGKSFGFAPGLEAMLNTSTNDALGYGVNVMAPVVFFGFPGLLGKGSIFAPGYQYLFDIGGGDYSPDVSVSQIDLYFVWVFAKGRNWLTVNPQALIDHKNHTEPMLIDVEWGFMIAQSAGASGWIRPGAGFGPDAPYTWNIEAGLKFVWR